MEEHCYDLATNSCDGRCQGCCDCPIAAGLSPSRRVMKLYWEDSRLRRIETDKFMKELENDSDFMAEMKKITDDWRKSKEEDKK